MTKERTNQKRDFKPFYASPTVENSDRITRLLGGFTNTIESYLQLKMTHLAEKMHILPTNQRKMTLTETCAPEKLCYTQKISHQISILLVFVLSKGLLGKLRPRQYKSGLVQCTLSPLERLRLHEGWSLMLRICLWSE